jgi:hypothetical protein
MNIVINYFLFELQVRPTHQMGRTRRKKRRGRRMSLRKRLTLSNVLPSRSGCVCVCVCVCGVLCCVCLLALNVRV